MVKCTLLDRYGCVVTTPSPLYILQDEPSDNVVAAINLFTNSRDPPLQPALGRKGMHTHTLVSLSRAAAVALSAPPLYRTHSATVEYIS